jgi:hypothetical protein
MKIIQKTAQDDPTFNRNPHYYIDKILIQSASQQTANNAMPHTLSVCYVIYLKLQTALKSFYDFFLQMSALGIK